MLETPMYQKFRGKIFKFKIKLCRIESGGTIIGLPDWFFRSEWRDVWIEAKQISRWPVRDNTTVKIPYRPGQFNWIKEYQKLGGAVFLIVTYKNQWYLFKDIRKEYSKFDMKNLSILPTTNWRDLEDYELMNILNGA